MNDMPYEPVRVTAHWTQEGRFEPALFEWRAQLVTVEATGRSWEDENGLHVLCMAPGGQVFELLFRLQPAGWWLRAPARQVGLA